MQKLKQWTSWKFEDRKKADGSIYKTKIPVEMNGLPYKWQNKNLWLTFSDACKSKYSNIGFFFGSGIVGLDLDKCRNDENGEVEPWALETIRELNSYTELSPSRTGFHIFVRGELPKAGNRKGRMEIYSTGRFFTVTGWHIEGTPKTLENCATLAAVQDRMLAGVAVETEVPKAQDKPATVDESAEDWKIISSVAEDLKSRDGATIEKEIATRYPERFAARQATKKKRGADSYWLYTVKRFLEQTPANGSQPVKIEWVLEFTTADKFKMEKVEWLWKYRIPLGELTLFAGIPGAGKSQVSIDLIARITNGADFCDSDNPNPFGQDVILLSGEDSPSKTVLPRLTAAEANLGFVHFVKMTHVPYYKTNKTERQIALDTDLEQLQKEIKNRVNVKLVVMDPMDCYLGRLNKNKDSEMRPLMDKIANFAKTLNIAVVVVMHLNKANERAAIDRVAGGGSLVQAPRASWLFMKDPKEDKTRLMVPLKLNLASEEIANTLKYQIVTREIPFEENGTLETSAISWIGRDEENRSADEIFSAISEREPKDGKLKSCSEWVADMLRDGPKLTRDLFNEGSERGYSQATLRRSFDVLDCRKIKTEQGWWTALPEHKAPIRGFEYPSTREASPMEKEHFFKPREPQESDKN